MKIKRLLPLLLALGLMTGCTSGAAGGNSDIVTELKEPVEISFWHAMNGKQEESLTKLTEEFMAQNPNVKVNLQNQSSYNDLQQKLTATMASPSDLPTMTQAYTNWLYDAIQEDLVVDLKPYIENKDIAFDNYEDILAGLRSGVEMDGKIYGLPFNKSTEVIWYNKTILDELNLKAPTNYEELAAVSKAIYEAKGIAGAGFDALSTYFTTFLKCNDVTYDSTVDVTGDVAVDAANYYLDGIKGGYFRIAGTDKYLSGPLGNETVGMYMGSSAGETFVKQGAEGKFEVGVAPYPAEYALQQGTDLYVFSSATAEQKTAAYEYMKYLTTTESQITWALDTGYMPIRTTAIEADEYKNSGSMVAAILKDATKNLYINPVVYGSQSAYNEASTVMEGILADKNSDVKAALETFKTTLKSIWE